MILPIDKRLPGRPFESLNQQRPRRRVGKVVCEWVRLWLKIENDIMSIVIQETSMVIIQNKPSLILFVYIIYMQRDP